MSSEDANPAIGILIGLTLSLGLWACAALAAIVVIGGGR